MNRTDALSRLSSLAANLRGMGATALYLFGSTARGDAAAKDIDLFIDYDTSKPFSLIELVGMQQFLEHELNTEIDLTTRNSLHPLLRADIEQSAIQIF